ncbi:MAG: MarR family transcriptional regulator [Longicatena sp.]
MNARDALGLDIQFYDWNIKYKLPEFISSTFSVRKANINGSHCIVISPKDELPSSFTILKIIESLKKIEKLPVFLNLRKLSVVRKESLLGNNIPFILKKELVFLPFLGTLLADIDMEYMRVPERLSASTQVMLIWILYNQSDTYFMNDAIQELPFSSMTITRAYKQLLQTKFFFEKKRGAKVYLRTQYTKKELFEVAKPFLSTPVKKSGYMNKSDVSKDMVESGESALCAMLNKEAPLMQTFAIDKKLKDSIVLSTELHNCEEQVKVEIWDYAPTLFSTNTTQVDFLSLIISLLDNKEEGIQQAIETLLDRNLV